MLRTIRYHFLHLLDFAGRDARQTFWFWFLFLFLLNVAVSIIVTVPMMAEAMAIGMEAAPGGDPQAIEAAVMERVAARMGPVMTVSLVLGVINLLLMAASLTRRIHDSRKPGFWAVIIGLAYLASLFVTWSSAGDTADFMRQVGAAGDRAEALAFQREMTINSLIGWVPLIMLIVFGVMKSDPRPNRYGTEPVRF